MHVAIISHTYAEPSNWGKLRALGQLDVQITCFIPNRWCEEHLGHSWAGNTHEESNLTLVPVAVRRRLRTPAAAKWDLRQLRTRLARGEFDLVHVEEEPWSRAAHSATRAARRHGVPVVVFTWQNLARYPPFPLSLLRSMTLRLASGWVAGNQQAAALLEAIDPHRALAVLPQLGTALPDPITNSPTASGALRIGFVGRLVREKGVYDLLDGFAAVAARCSLDFVGDGPERDGLAACVRTLELAGRVRFHGSVEHDKVAAIWQELDVLVLPSRSTKRWIEQFGHVLIEAMAHGVVVVGSDSGAIPEVIGDAGVVVPEGNPRAIAAALEKLATNPELLRELGQKGRQRVSDQFTDARVAERLRRFWNEVLSGSRASRRQ